MSLIDDSDALRQSILEWLKDVPDLEEQILLRIFRLMEEFDTKGGYFANEKPSYQKLLQIQGSIEDTLKDAGYYKTAKLFISDLSKITDNTIALQKGLNSLDIERRSLTGIEKIWVNDTVENMLNIDPVTKQPIKGKLSVNFIDPVTDALHKAVTYGYSVQTTRDNLEKLVIGDMDENGKPKTLGKLNKYLTVTARDAVSQLQGEQQAAIQQAYDMKYLRYVGGLLTDSRGQCVRWKGMQYIAIEDLQEEINLAFKNQAARRKEGPHHWSGMIPDTTPQNFIINRGGWGCMHQAVPVRKRP